MLKISSETVAFQAFQYSLAQMVQYRNGARKQFSDARGRGRGMSEGAKTLCECDS